MKPLLIDAIQLEVGGFSEVQQLSPKEQQVAFDIPLKQAAQQSNQVILHKESKQYETY